MKTAVTASTVLVLGAKGHLGQVCVRAFAAAGWHVIAQARSSMVQMEWAASPNVVTLECDALDVAAIIAAVPAVDVIVHALNPNYARWDSMLPPLTAAVLSIAAVSGGLLMVPGNVYNFGAELPVMLTEETPFLATTAKAACRIQMESAIASAAGDGVKSVVIRAGDFIGASGSWLDMVIAKSLDKGVVTHMGPDDLAHAWAYLPDLAQVFVRVAERRSALSGFQVFHYAGLNASGAELHAALESMTGRKLKSKALSWRLLKVLALFSPMLRAVLPMRYLWQRPHSLVGARLDQFIGAQKLTPLPLALAATIGAGQSAVP